MSMGLGFITWITLEVGAESLPWTEVWLPHFVGFLIALASYVLFSLLPQQFIRTPIEHHAGHRTGHHPSASHTARRHPQDQ
jgi:hypothetical protein